MDLVVRFAGGRRVDVAGPGFVIHTDQSIAHGGEGTAPEPFDTFLAALGACAGAYVAAFCAARSIPLDGVRIDERCTFDATGKRLERVEMTLVLPSSFPQRHRAGVRAAVDACKVKKTLLAPPVLEVAVRVNDDTSTVVAP